MEYVKMIAEKDIHMKAALEEIELLKQQLAEATSKKIMIIL